MRRIDRRTALIAAAGCVVVAAWTVLIYRESALMPGNADAAGQILAGRDLLHGNWNLRGWRLGVDSFWTSEIPLHALAIAVVGMTPALFRIAPTALYLGTGLTGVVIASGGRRTAMTTVAALAVVVATFGAPGAGLAFWSLEPALHVGTIFYSILAMALCGSASRARGQAQVVWAAGGCVALTIALVGDPMALTIGVLPLGIGSIALLASRARRRAGLAWMVAAGGAVVMQRVAARVLGLFGGSPLLVEPMRLAPSSRWGANARLLPDALRIVVGVPQPSAASNPGDGLVWAAHLVVAALVVVLLPLAVAALRRPEERALQLTLLAAAGGSMVAFVVSPYTIDITSTRYLVPTVMVGGILLARWAVLGVEAVAARASRAGVVAGVALGLAALTAVVGLARNTTGDHVLDPAPELAAWLQSHHLRRGFASYWFGTPITVDSGGAVEVAPIEAGAGGVQPLHWMSSWAMYRTIPDRPATFVVLAARDRERASWNVGISEDDVVGALGPPVRRERVGHYYVVLVYDHDLAPAVGAPAAGRTDRKP